MPGLRIIFEQQDGDVIFVAIHGYLDGHTYRDLEAFFQMHMKSGIYRFIVQLDHLDHISSAGAALFVSNAGACQEKGGDIVLVQPLQQIIDVLEVLGVYDLFAVADDRDQAMEHFTAEGGAVSPKNFLERS